MHELYRQAVVASLQALLGMGHSPRDAATLAVTAADITCKETQRLDAAKLYLPPRRRRGA